MSSRNEITQPGAGAESPGFWRFVVAGFAICMLLAVAGFIVALGHGAPLHSAITYIVLPAACIVSILLSQGRRPRVLMLAILLADVETLLAAGTMNLGMAYAVLFPLVGIALAIEAVRGRALAALFVLGAATTYAGIVIALLLGPAAEISVLRPPIIGLVATAVFVIGGYAYLWRIQQRRADALATAQADAAARAVAEGERTLLATAVEQAADMVVITSPDGVVQYANPAFERITGYPVSEATGHDLRSLIRSADQPASSYEAIDGAIARGEPWTGDVVNRRRDGSQFEYEVTISPLRDADGSFVGVVNVGRDRSFEHELARALHVSEERFRTLLEKAPTAIGIGRAGRTVYVNRRYLELFGYDPGTDLTGRPIGEVWAPESRPTVQAIARHRAGGDDAPATFEGLGLRRDGTTFPVHVSSAALDLPDGPATVSSLTDMTEVRQAQADLGLQTRVRGAFLEVMHRVKPGASVEEAAAAMCDAIWTLPGVDFVTVSGFAFDGEVISVAHRAPDGFPPMHGTASSRTRGWRARVEAGPAAQYWQPTADDGTWALAFTEMGVKALAYSPIIHGGHADGMLMLATTDAAFANVLVERMPVVIDFSTTPSALLGERLHQHRIDLETRAGLEEVLAASAFETVFQPIVDLGSGETVGYEALTRFASRQPPDEAFADAWRIGLGAELELATLARAVFVGRELPPGRWLDVNVSPQLLADPDPLREILARAERPIVIEITEHQAIDDYAAIRKLVATFGPEVRIAVDDAGAGTANFNHIVELRPDLVKLDRSVVHHVNLNLGRQALVIAMDHFARTAGCRLVAEGIETEEEAATLRSLGVEFGQGYLLGRPVRVDELAAEPGAVRSARRRIRRIA